jgi:hypothetical protein
VTISAFYCLIDVHLLMATHALAMVSSKQPRPVKVLGIERERMTVPAIWWFALLGLCISAAPMMTAIAYSLNIAMERDRHFGFI